uniref:Phytanoyl-CoA dioxygenase n=1 Tax=Amphora coffeiformis TaxID=265554 RepID=A0A7S3L1Z3_9STRA
MLPCVHKLEETKEKSKKKKKKTIIAMSNDERMSLFPIRNKCVPYGNDQEILDAFEADGYCVVTNIFTQEEINEMMEESWTSERLLGKFDRNKPQTWGDPAWPQQDGGRNFLQSQNVFQDAVSWDIQGSEKLLHVQKLLYGRSDIMMSSVGRFGVMRPTANNPKWRTESSWLHWDQNPWTQPAFSKVQCAVCLTDNTPTSGGFACVPGFHREFQSWGEAHTLGSLLVNGKVIDESFGDGQPFPVPEDDTCQSRLVRVVAPAGSAVLWDSRLPHQNYPNTDENDFRVVHYTMMRIIDDTLAYERRRLLIQKRILMDLWEEPGLRFPHNLSRTACIVNCLEESPQTLEQALQEFGVEDPDSLREASKLVLQAGECEEQGDMSGAIKKHRQSIRVFPDIESWHEAIF